MSKDQAHDELDRTGEFEAERQKLIAQYGWPRAVTDTGEFCRRLGGSTAGLNSDEVLVRRFADKEHARAWHVLDYRQFGHSSLGFVEHKDGGTVGVMDIRTRLEAMRAYNESLTVASEAKDVEAVVHDDGSGTGV